MNDKDVDKAKNKQLTTNSLVVYCNVLSFLELVVRFPDAPTQVTEAVDWMVKTSIDNLRVSFHTLSFTI